MKTIVADLTVASLNALIKQLEDYKRDFNEKMDFFLESLAHKCQEVLITEYQNAVADANAFRDEAYFQRGDRANWNTMMPDVSYEPFEDGTHTGYIVTADGKDVCFLEFGTGMYAGFGSEDTEGLSFEVYPGSWSESHERTYQYWIRKGYDPKEYPYTIYPRNAFAKAYAEIRNSIHSLAREIFEGRS